MYCSFKSRYIFNISSFCYLLGKILVHHYVNYKEYFVTNLSKSTITSHIIEELSTFITASFNT